MINTEIIMQAESKTLQELLDEQIRQQNIDFADRERVLSNALMLAYNYLITHKPKEEQETAQSDQQKAERGLDDLLQKSHQEQGMQESFMQMENPSQDSLKDLPASAILGLDMESLIQISQSIHLNIEIEEFTEMTKALADHFDFNPNFVENSAYKQKLALLTMLNFKNRELWRVNLAPELLSVLDRANNFNDYIRSYLMGCFGAYSMSQIPDTVPERSLLAQEYSKQLAMMGILSLMKKPTPSQSFETETVVAQNSTMPQIVSPKQNTRIKIPEQAKPQPKSMRAEEKESKEATETVDQYRQAAFAGYASDYYKSQMEAKRKTALKKKGLSLAAKWAIGTGATIGGGALVVGTAMQGGDSSAPANNINPSGFTSFLINHGHDLLAHLPFDHLLGFC